MVIGRLLLPRSWFIYPGYLDLQAVFLLLVGWFTPKHIRLTHSSQATCRSQTFGMRRVFFLNLFSIKAHIESRSNFKNLQPVDELIELLIHFLKVFWNQRHPSLCFNLILSTFSYQQYISLRVIYIEKYTRKITCRPVLIQASVCVLNFILPACKPNFAEIACTA